MAFQLIAPSVYADQKRAEAGVRLPSWADTVENADVLRFLDGLARAQQLEDSSGGLDKAAELAVRSLMSAAAMWQYHGLTAAAGVRAVLADQVCIFVNTAWSWRNQSVAVVNPAEAADRAQVVEAAAAKVAEMQRALETEFAL